MNQPKPECRVTVVVPCLNEEKCLPELLGRLAKQDMPPDSFEVIVVDGGSIDKTVEIAAEMGAKVIKSERGVSVQRNNGVAVASAPLIAFIDADCLPGPDWLRRGVELLEGGAAIAGGPVFAPDDFPVVAKAWDVHNLSRISRLRDEHTGPSRLITTQNLFVTREVFRAAGGFDETVVAGEDSLFCDQVINKQGNRAAFDERLTLLHLGQPRSIPKFFKEQAWHCQREVRGRLKSSGHGGDSFAYAKLTIATLIAAGMGALLSMALKSSIPAFAGVAAVIGLPTMVSARTCLRVNSFKMFLPLIAVYFTFGAARAAAILGFYRPSYHRRNVNPAESGFR